VRSFPTADRVSADRLPHALERDAEAVLGRAEGTLHHLGDLLHRVPEPVAQEENLAVAIGETAEIVEQRPRQGIDLAVVRLGAREFVGFDLAPQVATLATAMTKPRAHRDAIRPALERRVTAVGACGAQDLDEGLLGSIVGILGIEEQRTLDTTHALAQPCRRLAARLRIPLGDPRHERDVVERSRTRLCGREAHRLDPSVSPGGENGQTLFHHRRATPAPTWPRHRAGWSTGVGVRASAATICAGRSQSSPPPPTNPSHHRPRTPTRARTASAPSMLRRMRSARTMASLACAVRRCGSRIVPSSTAHPTRCSVRSQPSMSSIGWRWTRIDPSGDATSIGANTE